MTLPIDRRTFLVSIPTLVAAHRLMAQGGVPPIRVNGLSQLTLTVSDPKRSIDFYQGLFGMPIQARHGTTTLLRIGAGPRFLAIVPAGAGEQPSISRFGMGVEGFNVDAILKILEQNGVTPADAAAPGASGGAMKVRVTTRGTTREMFVGDPNGIVFQLHDVSYCGGTGALGNVCQAEPSPSKGVLAVKDLSHFTNGVSDNPRTVEFYQKLFGFQVQANQGTPPAAPVYGVGPGVHFLMFTGGAAGGARGAAAGGGAAGGGRAGVAAGAGDAAAGGRGAGGAAGAGNADPAARGAGGGAAGGRAGGAGGRGGAPAGPRIDHACLSMDNFNPDVVTKTLNAHGLKSGQRSDGPLVTYISLRTEARGGAPGTGTPELYFTDPDGLAIQIQDVKYCGGGGFLGDVCPS
jgi:catechol 2,3-dioxygenase-like lactoylglutathione lyase family enzyme